MKVKIHFDEGIRLITLVFQSFYDGLFPLLALWLII